MTAVHTFEVDGHQFTMIFSPAASESGVVVQSDTKDELLDDPLYLAALRKALNAYRVIHAVLCLEDRVSYDVGQGRDIARFLARETDEYLSETVAWYRIALEQPFTKVNDAVLAFGAACEQEIQRREQKELESRAKAAQQVVKRQGFIYLLRSSTGLYKIGKTKNPADRIRTFEVKLPFEVEFSCVIPTGDMRGLEISLHKRFAEKRVNGEWFDLLPADIEYIKGLSLS